MHAKIKAILSFHQTFIHRHHNIADHCFCVGVNRFIVVINYIIDTFRPSDHVSLLSNLHILSFSQDLISLTVLVNNYTDVCHLIATYEILDEHLNQLSTFGHVYLWIFSMYTLPLKNNFGLFCKITLKFLQYHFTWVYLAVDC